MRNPGYTVYELFTTQTLFCLWLLRVRDSGLLKWLEKPGAMKQNRGPASFVTQVTKEYSSYDCHQTHADKALASRIAQSPWKKGKYSKPEGFFTLERACKVFNLFWHWWPLGIKKKPLCCLFLHFHSDNFEVSKHVYINEPMFLAYRRSANTKKNTNK